MTNTVNLPVYSPTLGTVPVQYNTPVYQPAVTPVYNAPAYNTDNVNLSYTTQVAQPQAQVGIFDKVSSYFKNVYRSDDNLRAYKLFEQDMKANAGAYLQVGSSDKTKVLDIQQKLNIVGIKCNVNGIFGNATSDAVSEFKEMSNINDGFLNKKGQPARTGIVTPQMWTVLNAMVSKKLNPNSQVPGTGNPMPVTQEELNWAAQIQNKVKNFGYKPTKQEYVKYNDILERAQAQSQPQNTVVTQPQVMPTTAQVTQDELNWALALQDRVEKQGYKPTPDEVAKYNDIYTRYANSQTVATQPQVQSQASAGSLTQDELNWALALQDRVEKQGYKPTPEEVAKFTDIFNRYQAVQNSTAPQQVQPQTPAGGVTQEELNWALALQDKVEKQGYKPTPEEVTKYTDIFNRYQAGQTTPQFETPQFQPTTPASVVPQGNAIVLGNAMGAGTKAVWQNALGRVPGLTGNWNTDRENLYWVGPNGERIKQTDLTPNQANMLTTAWQLVYMPGNANQTVAPQENYVAPQTVIPTAPTNGLVSQEELNWAANLYDRVSKGYAPTQDEIIKFNKIQLNAVRTVSNQPTAPVFPSAATMQAAPVTQEELNWAIALQDKVQKNNYQATQDEIARYTDIFNRYQKSGVNQQVAPQTPVTVQAPAPATGVTQEEMNWALALQDRVEKNNYQPTQDEIARYTDIFNRYQATQTTQTQSPIQIPAPQLPNNGTQFITIDASNSDPQLQWALNLLDRFRLGYQPTDEEMRKYEEIIARFQVPAATP